MTERKIGFDRATLDGKVLEETDAILTMRAVIAREIVQDYPEGKAYKPAEELEKAAWTAEGRWVTTMEHPATGLITRRSDIKGRMSDIQFRKDVTDPKTKRPNIRGIDATITWFKDKNPKQMLDDVKSGALRDVSIGFTYEQDDTPGEFNGEHYDYVQRNIMIDHLVAPCPQGRCPSPYCGIGVDSILDKTRIAGDPWEETENSIRSGHRGPGEFDPDSMRTITITNGVKAVVGCPKGKYKGGKCTVGMEVQSYIFDNEKFTVAEAKAWFAAHKDAVDLHEADALSVTEIMSKIEELRDKRDAIRGKLDDKYKAMKPTPPDPEVQKLYEEIEDLDAEIKAYRELKVQRIVSGADCPICMRIEELGVLEASKRFAAKYGTDALTALDDTPPPPAAPPAAPPATPPAAPPATPPPAAPPPQNEPPTIEELIGRAEELLAMTKRLNTKPTAL